jgi:hypothetical protein
MICYVVDLAVFCASYFRLQLLIYLLTYSMIQGIL